MEESINSTNGVTVVQTTKKICQSVDVTLVNSSFIYSINSVMFLINKELSIKQGILLKEQEKGSIPRWVHSKVIGSHIN